MRRELFRVRDRELPISDELENELESERSEVGGEDEDGRPELRKQTTRDEGSIDLRRADLLPRKGQNEDPDSHLEEQSIP